MKENLQKGLALDIDDTLSVTALTWAEKMIPIFGNPDNLTATEIIALYRYTHLAPFWKTPEVDLWLREQTYNEEAYRELPLIENSHHVIQKIQEHIPLSCYLTLRPEKLKQETTLWLQRHGFPNLPILCRPNDLPWELSHQWKAQQLQELFPTVQGIIDDNPSIIQHLPGDYAGTIFLYDHLEYDHSTNLNIIPCKTWDHVYETIKKLSDLPLSS